MITKYNNYIKESIDSYFFQTYDEIDKWLDTVAVSGMNKIINKDLTVNATYIIITSKNLYKIPVQFYKISDFFDCEKNNLISLKGCPIIINGDMDCSNNKLTSLKYCPIVIDGDFDCNNNPLEDINDLNSEILIRCIKRNKTWIHEIKKEVFDKYFEHWITKDTSILEVLKDKVSDNIKQKYSHLFQANNFNLL